MKFNKIVFHNSMHCGDLFLSKEYVRAIINLGWANKYEYQSPNPNLIRDIPCEYYNNLDKYPELPNDLGFLKHAGDLYIGTWYNACGGKYYQGTNIHTLHKYFCSEFYKMFAEPAPFAGPITENVIPQLPSVENIQLFELFNSVGVKKILICNNSTLSGQSSNWDMTPMILDLARKNPRIQFLVSNHLHVKHLPYNIFPIWGSTIKPDLNEIGQISQLCDYIIGRGSGPYTFCLNRDTMKSKSKFIYIIGSEGHKWDNGTFGLDKLFPEKFNWIDESIPQDAIFNKIMELINV